MYLTNGSVLCRFKSEVARVKEGHAKKPSVVPAVLADADLSLYSPQRDVSRLPDTSVDLDTVFLCRYVYDVKLRRILKNPPLHASAS